MRIALGAYPWAGPKLIVSASLSLGARRVYVYAVYGDRFPSSDFQSRMGPLLERDAEEWGSAGLPWEGVGGWHPVFPARVDDVWLLASAAVKRIVGGIEHPRAEPQLTEIEQFEERGEFAGVHIR